MRSNTRSYRSKLLILRLTTKLYIHQRLGGWPAGLQLTALAVGVRAQEAAPETDPLAVDHPRNPLAQSRARVLARLLAHPEGSKEFSRQVYWIEVGCQVLVSLKIAEAREAQRQAISSGEVGLPFSSHHVIVSTIMVAMTSRT
jgi:hypothetical protein